MGKKKKNYRIVCQRAGCKEDATRLLQWRDYSRESWMMCEGCAAAAVRVVHI